jgi:hypothetical protein
MVPNRSLQSAEGGTRAIVKASRRAPRSMRKYNGKHDFLASAGCGQATPTFGILEHRSIRSLDHLSDS